MQLRLSAMRTAVLSAGCYCTRQNKGGGGRLFTHPQRRAPAPLAGQSPRNLRSACTAISVHLYCNLRPVCTALARSVCTVLFVQFVPQSPSHLRVSLNSAISLPLRYAMPVTELLYGYIGCPVLTKHTRYPVLTDHISYAMPGTERAYAGRTGGRVSGTAGGAGHVRRAPRHPVPAYAMPGTDLRDARY
eukprot:3941322-Rhodomonas_salina.5